MEETQQLSGDEFEAYRHVIYSRTGISMNDAKQALIQSRLQKHVRELRLESFGQYLQIALNDPGEMRNLINSITTNKTEFFRERHHFDFLANRYFPEMIAKAREGSRSRRLRVWHAGCSTGEEPYSMAMIVRDHLLQVERWDVRLLATDIDTDVLTHAREGVYEADRCGMIEPDVLKRHFLRGKGPLDGRFRVRPELQEMIVFRELNLIKRPWPLRSETRFDIIFCRNVAIYFDRKTQRDLLREFTRRLVPDGLLFLGHSESVLGVTEHFRSLGPTIFQVMQVRQEAA